MARFVPQPNCRLGQIVFIAQCAPARSAQQEVPAARCVETEPAGGELAGETPGGLSVPREVNQGKRFGHVSGPISRTATANSRCPTYPRRTPRRGFYMRFAG